MFYDDKFTLDKVSDFCYKTFKVRPRSDMMAVTFGSGQLEAASNIVFRLVSMGANDFSMLSRVSVIFDDLSPTHGRLPIAPQIDVPKDLSSEMSLEVA